MTTKPKPKPSPKVHHPPGTRSSFPQVIAHRGYKAAFPENTMAAFRGAVDVGADSIETDLRLSGDGVVVLSHVSLFAHLTYLPMLSMLSIF